MTCSGRLLDSRTGLFLDSQAGLICLDEGLAASYALRIRRERRALRMAEDMAIEEVGQRLLRHAPFGKDAFVARVYPYHLKQFNDRWYLIAQAFGYDTYGHYALDRIVSFEMIDVPYVESEVDFSEYFDDVIGVTVPERWEPVDVLLRIRDHRYNYIKTKPLHLTQREVGKEDGYTRVTINVKINKELIALLLSYGSDIEVLSPASLRIMIKKEISAMSYKYRIDEENLHT